MTEKKIADEEAEALEAQRELLFQARKRALFALGGTFIVAAIALMFVRTCNGDVPSSDACKTNRDCDGIVGVECLRAPTATYCTHACDRNEDCDKGFHCESPPWEKNTTRLLCLKDIAPPTK